MNLRRNANALIVLLSLVATLLSACATTGAVNPYAGQLDQQSYCGAAGIHPEFKATIGIDTVFSAADIVQMTAIETTGVTLAGHGGVSIQLNPDGATRLAQFTADHIGHIMTLSGAGGAVLMEPVIQEAIQGGSIVLTLGANRTGLDSICNTVESRP